MLRLSVKTVHSDSYPAHNPWNLSLDSEPMWLWRGREDGTVWIARGVHRVCTTIAECRLVLASLPLGEDATEFGVRCFCGLAFDRELGLNGIWEGFREGYVLPRITARIEKETMTILDLADSPELPSNPTYQLLAHRDRRVAPSVQPSVGCIPTQDSWRLAVRYAIESIRAGLIEKVALARTKEVRTDRDFDTASVLERLASESSGCALFMHYQPKVGVFLGASPERLFRQEGALIFTESLAGSRPRGESRSQDCEFETELVASAKDRSEHEIVTRFLEKELQPLTEHLQFASAARVRKLNTVQHLAREGCATLRAGRDADGVLEALHPTPAVCGWPRTSSYEVIRRLEQTPRGFYAGAVGWVDHKCSEFTVAIRSALIKGSVAYVFGGAGIVAASDADAEWNETEWKMLPMLRALGAV